MTTSSAQDRVEKCRLLLREAEVLREAAEQHYIVAYSNYLEAKVLATPGLDLPDGQFDRQSSAERYRDTEQARLERSDAP